MNTIISTSSLTKHYGRVHALDGLDLKVDEGQVHGFLGPNGAGKSTLLKLLAGVEEPQGGTITLAPSDAFVGWLPQEHERIAGETVAQYIATGMLV